MPFAGIVTRDAYGPRHLHAMLAAMQRDGSGAIATCSVPESGIWLGWLDGRAACSRVASSEHLGRTLVFDGEHFDVRSGRGVGEVDGVELCAGYDPDALDWLRRLNGWFAGALIDRQRREVALFTDRLGLRRVYYTEWDGGWAFASEAKALLAIRPACRAFDEQGLGELFAIGCVSGEGTLFRHIRRLPGAALWRLRASAPIVRRAYLDAAELERQPPLTAAEYREGLYAAMERVVPRYFGDHARSAVSLTGGLDSRAVMAFAGDIAEPRRSYTYRGMYRDPYDVTIARRVAAACRFDHEVIVLGENFVRQFAGLAEATVRVTDGTADVLVAHELFLSRFAKDIAPVRITGNFGSEIFRGISQFRPLGLPAQLFRREFLPHVSAPTAALAARKAAHPISFAIFQELPNRLYGRLAVAQSELVVRTPFTDNDFLALAYRAPSAEHDVHADWIAAIERRSPALAAIPTDRVRLGTGSASRLARLVNTLQFKAEWHYDMGMRHTLVRVDDLLFGRTPPPFVGTHKIEHYRRWFRRGPMLDYVSDVLSSASRLYDHVDRRAVDTMLQQHRAGTRNYTAELALITTAALTARLLIEHPYHDHDQMTGSVVEHVAG